jgi:hypothetical protein
MTSAQHAYLSALLTSFFADRPKQSVSDWCVQSLRFNEPNNSGPFSLAGREYAREILDSQADALISDEVLVFGSQAGKTATVMGKAAWTIRNNPSRIFWVMPTRDTVQKFSRTRWSMLIRNSPELAALVPTGARRHDFSTFQQMLGGAIIDFVWSNSPAALASVPAPVVILDEVDKFDEGGRREANAVELANQRTKSFAVPKRIKTSTPTLTEGLIWQEFLKTDQRRRFLPCPHCGKFMVLVWAKNFTAFKLTGSDAEIKWDKEAKREDGTWDLDRVERSARMECPHCGGHIRDAHKTVMDRQGEWRPTAKAANGYRGWHLPSLYSASAETNFGKLAIKFLQAKNSLLGLQGFINGDLAEPYESQDRQTERIEVVTQRFEISEEWEKVMFVDCQATNKDGGYFWYVCRAHSSGKSHGFDAGPLQTWDEVRDKQQAHRIRNDRVVVDSGWGGVSDDTIYANCVRFCEIIPSPALGKLPFAFGWTPSKGMPGRKRWKDKKTGLSVPYFMRPIDPFIGTADAGKVEMELFEFPSDYFRDILENMRRGAGDYKWSVEQTMASETYWRHMDAYIKEPMRNARTGRITYEWKKRSSHWPDHLNDCEVGNNAYAAYLGVLKAD